MAGIPTTEVNKILDALMGGTAFQATSPMKLALESVIGSDAAVGTEVVGGSYARQTIASAAASARAISNNSIINFTVMPAITTVAVAIFDSTGTPRRMAWGALTASKTTGAGDTLSFAVAAVTLTFT